MNELKKENDDLNWKVQQQNNTIVNLDMEISQLRNDFKNERSAMEKKLSAAQ